jgi:hypothetical protein
MVGVPADVDVLEPDRDGVLESKGTFDHGVASSLYGKTWRAAGGDRSESGI